MFDRKGFFSHSRMPVRAVRAKPAGDACRRRSVLALPGVADA
ncbi:hypothetical protein BZL30_3123 [Mycobacterium kansasii]|uniref:Uncharacterized protein n=1 Tax=Mycobacterium kansasii TaxID=1768 RepID=A0A1V3XAS7_MYCKA|nr:hypothetical protein BZL29_4821 [Mycobacterium kansasii]OOK76262.1 hypothetical protein BZL30_3123 [Mycobacterium kansasii]